MQLVNERTFEDHMKNGHEAMQAEHNVRAVTCFHLAVIVSDDDSQVAEALQMKGVALRKLGDTLGARLAFEGAIAHATSPLQQGKVLRDLGLLLLDLAEAPTGSGTPRYDLYGQAEEELEESYKLLVGAKAPIEVATTSGCIGRVAYHLGDFTRARSLMQGAARGIRKHPVYSFNNRIWRVIASPWRRWYLIPVGLWSVVTQKDNRTFGALVRVLASAGGYGLYDAVRRRSNR